MKNANSVPPLPRTLTARVWFFLSELDLFFFIDCLILLKDAACNKVVDPLHLS